MKADLRIRPPAPGEDRAIVELMRAAWNEAYRALVPPDLSAELTVEERLRSRTERHAEADEERREWVAAAAGAGGVEEVLGYASTGPERDAPEPGAARAEVYSLYVLPRAQRSGVGRRLLEHALEDLRRRAFADVCLWVLTENAPARRFYEALGFRAEREREPKTLRGRILDHARYVLRLGPAAARPRPG